MRKDEIEQAFVQLLLQSGTSHEQLRRILEAHDSATRASELCDKINNLAKTVSFASPIYARQ